MKKIGLIDADSITHITAYSYKLPKELIELADGNQAAIDNLYKDSFEERLVLEHVDQFISSILTDAQCNYYRGFLGTSDPTFRHLMAVTKPYKGQRGSKPHWTKYWDPIMKKHMVEKWGFDMVPGIEADDACAVFQRAYNQEDSVVSIICSPDKDLKQVPGLHYDYKKCVFESITELDAARRLQKQIIVGDSTDNIAGAFGIGAKSKLLFLFDQCDDISKMPDITKRIFINNKHDDKYYKEMCMLVTMKTELNELSPELLRSPLPFESTLNSSVDEAIEVEEEEEFNPFTLE